MSGIESRFSPIEQMDAETKEIKHTRDEIEYAIDADGSEDRNRMVISEYKTPEARYQSSVEYTQTLSGLDQKLSDWRKIAPEDLFDKKGLSKQLSIASLQEGRPMLGQKSRDEYGGINEQYDKTAPTGAEISIQLLEDNIDQNNYNVNRLQARKAVLSGELQPGFERFFELVKKLTPDQKQIFSNRIDKLIDGLKVANVEISGLVNKSKEEFMKIETKLRKQEEAEFDAKVSLLKTVEELNKKFEGHI